MPTRSILVVEDDPTLSKAVSAYLKHAGYEVDACQSPHQAVDYMSWKNYSAILSDLRMPDMSGAELLEKAQQLKPEIPFILMTAYGSVEKAVECMRKGAYDFLCKPFSMEALENVLKNTMEVPVQASLATASLAGNLAEIEQMLLTQDEGMQRVLNIAREVALSKATVLIQGESGTGKELLARYIHQHSLRNKARFVAINCAALPEQLLESELFGHERGSFTGAFSQQRGKFELAHGGTILLDEISEMSLNLQAKLLRVLQEYEIFRVGGNKPIALDIRVIATSNRDLSACARQGTFREDLYYRLNVIPTTLPPLRNRSRDLIYLAEYFLANYAKRHGRTLYQLTDRDKDFILHYAWPGNIRELKNSMERAIFVGSLDFLEQKSPAEIASGLSSREGLPASTAEKKLSDIERAHILQTLVRFRGNRTHAARHLDISLRTLRNKLSQYRHEGHEVTDPER